MASEERKFFYMSAQEVLGDLQSSWTGLSGQEAEKRLNEYGYNKLEEKKKKSLLAKFLDQFKNLMIIVLLVAAVISGVVAREWIDAGIILFVVVLNAVLGVVQENKAERSLEALKSMSAPFAKVMRDGEVRHIKTDEIVIGDVVILEAGDFVPADIRLIEVASLKVEEAASGGANSLD